MKTVLLVLFAAFVLSACEEYVERPAHRRYVTYVPGAPYYNVYYDYGDRPYYRRYYYEDEPSYRTYTSRRYYYRPGARVIVGY